MVELRRFGPLMACALLAFALLVARLFQVQVVEHAVWAREAANLVRSSTVVPYRRGTLRDRHGRPLVRDEEAYEIEFVWRGFRRGHPLGQVAQMRSLLEGRTVPLAEALPHLEEWALELVGLSPAEIDAFGEGAGVERGSLVVPPSPDPRRERLAARRGDLHFYVKALLDLSPKHARRVSPAEDDPGWRSPYAELAARELDLTRAEVEAALVRRIALARAHLEVLAQLLEPDRASAAAPLARLVEVVEDARRRVEDAAADDLFRKATGFGAWRLDAANLGRIELDWLRRCLYWDSERLERWIADRGTLFERAVDEYLAGYAIASFKVGSAEPTERVLDGLAHWFRPVAEQTAVSTSWRTTDELVALGRLGEVAGVPVPPRAEELATAPVLPLQDAALRRSSGAGRALLAAALAGVELPASGFEAQPSARGPEALADALVAVAESSAPTWQARDAELVGGVMKDWHRRLQARVHELIDELVGEGAGLALAPERVDAASEERAYVVRDRSARPRRVVSEPSYELVHLITRYPERCAGFEVRSTMRRVPVAFDGERDPRPLAELLIGKVRTPFLADLLEQRPSEETLTELRLKLDRTEEDEERIRELATSLTRVDEQRGGTGIEGAFDRDLRGRNGYRETLGLQDRQEGRHRGILEPPIDGSDLRLTLDVDLQRAAQHVLEHPAPAPPGDPRPDLVWTRFPVGALCLITPEGEVLAAASVPRIPSEGHWSQDGQRAVAIDRTLQQPVFHPPGSVFKPFVAAWALQFLGLDPEQGLVPCAAYPGEPAHYGKVRCWNSNGHSHWSEAGPEPIDLHSAIVGSCNSYFAFVGEQFFQPDDFRALAAAYGFGRPTGVRPLGPDRFGLVEQPSIRGPLGQPGADLPDVARQRLGNGLTHLTAAPLQVARAYAGLATGALPELRLVRAVGDHELPARAEPLPIGPEVLHRIHTELASVVGTSAGTAHGKGLDEADLGFRLAAKTGSADLGERRVPADPHNPWTGAWIDGMRKHTWVAGWFPAEDPAAILVVFVHDTSTTSSHGAVYLAAQFLQHPSVTAYLEERRAESAGAGAQR